jgi:hypothetical protein
VIQERKASLGDATSKQPFALTEEDISICEWVNSRILKSATSDSLIDHIDHLPRATTPAYTLGGAHVTNLFPQYTSPDSSFLEVFSAPVVKYWYYTSVSSVDG